MTLRFKVMAIDSPDCGTTLTWWGSSPDAPKASIGSISSFLGIGNNGWRGASGAKSPAVKENTKIQR